MSIKFIGLLVGLAVVGFLILGMIITRLYKRASKETAFVRTGMGGQKVIKDGGALVIPVVHETLDINMQTLRLSVNRGGQNDSLITKDRLRVDVNAEFYVRVAPDTESIATAAQTLGRRTMDPSQLSTLVEGKFVDALRAAAASMDMQDLHEKRTEFVQKVKTTVAEDLKQNGLELESVSLTNLNQTDISHFDANNAFDAEGLAVIAKVTSARRKERNDIEKQTEVEIETKNLESTKRTLELKQEGEFARLDQEKQVQTRAAEQESQLAIARAEREREAAVAAEAAKQASEQARIERERGVKVSQTEADQATELAAQASRIAVAEKSEAESKAKAKADEARAEATKAAENVTTVSATARADREAQIAVIAAEGEAKQKAASITVQAEAELKAADSQAKAKERLIEADAKRYEVESTGQRSLHEAGNVISPESMNFQLRKAMVERLPEIIESMTKPIEKIDSFRVVHMNGGLNMGHGAANDGAPALDKGSLSNQMTDALLNYRMQVPFVDALGKELGIDFTQGMNGMVTSAGLPVEVSDLPEEPKPSIPTEAPRSATTREAPLAPEDKAEIQKLAGIANG